MLPSAVQRGEGEAESKGSPSPGPPEGRQDSRERSRVGEARGPSLVTSSQKPHVSSAATLLCSPSPRGFSSLSCIARFPESCQQLPSRVEHSGLQSQLCLLLGFFCSGSLENPSESLSPSTSVLEDGLV